MRDFLFHYEAKVMSVYDGDTIRLSIDLGFGVEWRGSDGKGLSIRLYGLDTPELRGSEKKRGVMVRDKVREMILGKKVTLKTIKDSTGKYGRYLGVIITEDGVNLNDFLLENNFATKVNY